MFIQRTQRKTKDKVYHSVALMENYREGKKVKHRTIATLFNAGIDKQEVKEQGQLDGCYVVKTSVTKEEVPTQAVHDRHKDLGLAESDFSTMKTTIKELRQICARKKDTARIGSDVGLYDNKIHS